MIASNKLTSNLMKPWGSNYVRNKKSQSLRDLVHLQVDFDPKTGDIYIRFTINFLLQMIVVR